MADARTPTPPGRRARRRWSDLAALLAGILLLSAVAAAAEPVQRPNIVVVVVDDAAFMDFGAYGGEARTPTIDALARRGAMLTGYRSSPLCSPSRAMLLTGVDNHRTGVATIEEVLPREHQGKPGYTLHFEPGVQTIATRLKAAGYRTYMAGKWHLGHGPGDLPSAHGFDRSLALGASGADNWAPKPYIPYYREAPWFEDGEPATMPPAFYSSEMLVDRTIDYLRADYGEAGLRRTGPSEPFFVYLAFQAVHIPVQAPADFTARYAGRFDAGWEALRQARFERARELGLIPADAALAAPPPGMRPWDSLSSDEKRIYAKSMAVYSAMLEAMDHHIGRLLAWLEESGQLANTVIVVTSDNGPEPSDPVHTTGMGFWMWLNGYSWEVEHLGEPGSLNFIGPEWATAVASPLHLFKFYMAEGGIRVPLVIAGPGIDPARRVGTPAFVTDVTPTLLDLAGVAAEGGVAMTGRTLRPVLDGRAERAHPQDVAIGMEVAGNAALFRGDYKLVRNLPPYGDDAWRLYDLSVDPGETDDLGARQPELAAELRRAYDAYAAEMGVQPMPEGYDVHTEIMINAAKRQLSFYAWQLALVLIAIVGASALVVRRRRGGRAR